MIEKLTGLLSPLIASRPSVPGSIRRQGSRRRDSGLEREARQIVEPFCASMARSLVVGWSSRMRTTAGVAILSKDEIWLNPALCDLPGDEVRLTLLHELAHLLARHRNPRRRIAPHGPEWREACRDLGIGGESRTHALPFHVRRLKRRYLLRCPACGRHHERVRMPRRPLACLHCCREHNGGLYDAKYRFVVKGIGSELGNH